MQNTTQFYKQTQQSPFFEWEQILLWREGGILPVYLRKGEAPLPHEHHLELLERTS